MRPARLAVCRQQMQQHPTTCCLVLVTAARRAAGSPVPPCGQPTAGADRFACAGCHARHRQAGRGRQLSALRAIFGLVVWGGAVALPRVANAGRGREQPVLAACRTLPGSRACGKRALAFSSAFSVACSRLVGTNDELLWLACNCLQTPTRPHRDRAHGPTTRVAVDTTLRQPCRHPSWL